jgi:hypothetical protein
MNANTINKELILKSITKIVADKNSVRSFLKGKISIETLTENGIKLAKPL